MRNCGRLTGEQQGSNTGPQLGPGAEKESGEKNGRIQIQFVV
jgi:hypothetical protein